jgi:hypothetical protein
MASELKWSILTTVLMVLTFVFPRARVLTIPLFLALVMVLIFWSARVSAEREE